MIFTAALTVIMLSMAIGIEAGMMYLTKRKAQTAADAAALAGALELVRGRTDAVVIGSALAASARNGFADGDGDVSVEVIIQPNLQLDTIDVAVRTRYPLIFASVAGIADPEIRAVARAGRMRTGEACAMSTDSNAAPAIVASGNASLVIEGCSMVANSDASNAFSVGGQAQIIGEGLWTPGGVLVSGQAEVPMMVRTWPMADPHEGLANQIPALADAPSSQVIDGVRHFYPGAYPNGLFIQGNPREVRLHPGSYVVDGGLTFANQMNITHAAGAVEGVNLIVRSGEIAIGANARASLTALGGESNLFSGVLLYQHPNVALQPLELSASLDLNGVIYLPKVDLALRGSALISSKKCLQIVARTIDFAGNMTLSVEDCAALGVASITVDLVRLLR